MREVECSFCVCLITLLYNFAIFFGYFILLYAVMYLQILIQKQREKQKMFVILLLYVEIDSVCIEKEETWELMSVGLTEETK